MKRRPLQFALPAFSLLLAACASPAPATPDAFTDLSTRAKPDPVVTEGWREVVIGAPDINEISRLWTEIGGFEIRERDDGMVLLGAPGVNDWGLIRLVAADGEPTRPYGSQAWDTGCYFSVMHRAKNLGSIVADARALGWTTLTDDIVYLEFGPSKLHVVVLSHPPTGVQVQLYERLTTPLPDTFPDFDRISVPFNIMQMVRDRDASFDFFQQGLGFATFYYGKPYRSEQPEVIPINIPPELTTEIAYSAAIVSPLPDMEWGRMEMIAIEEDPRLEGKDLSARCDNPVGIRHVVFDLPPTDDPDELRRAGLEETAYPAGVPTEPTTRTFTARTPDNALIVFESDLPL